MINHPTIDAANNRFTTGQGYTYDFNGNIIQDAEGRSFTFNGDDKQTGVENTAINAVIGQYFYYDGKGLSAPQTPNYAKGKLTKVTSSDSATEYQLFDNLGRMTQMSQITDGHTYTSKYTYNFAGALVEEEYPSGRKVKNEFESDGDLLKVSSQKNSSSVYTPYASNFSYTASGGISQMKLGNGRWETAKFNTRLQVTELGLGSSATNAGLWKTAYEYGELQANGTVDTTENTGNIAKQTLTVPGTSFTQSYKYDSLYRLTEATEKTGSTQNWTQSWNYDRYGNRVGFAQNIAGFTDSPNPAVDANTNRFSSGQGFTYDLNGNLVIDNEGRQFTFNGDNKQTEVKDAQNNVIGQYFYDGEGKRVKKITNSETTVFVYSSGKLVAEYSNQVSQAPTVAYTTTDHLGSPRIITDQYGQVKSRRDFMPFGEEIFENVGARTAALHYSSTTDDIRQKFTGYQKDSETQLDFAEARMYENRFGRFTAVDPLLASGKSANPQTFNRYAYTSNNPIDRVDSDGQDWTRVKNTRIIGSRVYTTWIPVWKDNAAGSNAWKNMVYRIQYGKDRGKWAALDPWNDRWTLADTRAGAIAAYEGYRSQVRVDATAGAVQPVVDTVNLAEIVATKGASLGSGDRGLGTKIRDAIFGAFGANPNESSGPFRSANNLFSALVL